MSEGNVQRAEILPLMGEVKLEGEWTMGFCPAHADGQKHGMKSGRSLGLSKSGVLRCFAGCDFKDVMASLRTTERPRVRTQQADQWPKDPVRVYEYIDASGTLLAVKGRFERPSDGGKPEKKFLWRLPEGTYYDGIKPLRVTDMPLWGIAALDGPGRVWFTEGEEAARAIQSRNEIAVCGAWGASQRDFGEALGVLAGRTVVLWPDNDPPGREYMAEIRKALRGIAKSVSVVAAPVPPKGDAVEFFQAGGKLESLLANVLDKPTVDVYAMNHLGVRIPTEEGPVGFDFDRISRTAGAMDCELTISHSNPSFEAEPYSLRINILSASARSQLETALRKQFTPTAINWTLTVSTAFARVRQAHNDMDRTVHVSALPDMDAPEFLVDVLLPLEADTIIFGDGSSGKTYMAYAMGLEVATGGAFCGYRAKPGGVLILDYETGKKMAKLRLRRLLLGMDMDPNILAELPIHYIEAEGVPLPELRDTLRMAIERHDIKLVIIDAAGDACGGEPEKAGVVLNYFNACSELKATRLHIAHVTNSEMEVSAKRPFGSRYWHNRARRTWFVKRDQEEESDIVDIGIICRKVNDGRLPKPIAFQVRFEGDNGPVRMAAEDFRKVIAFEQDQSQSDRVASFLAAADGPQLITDISAGLGLTSNVVGTVLDRGRKSNRFVVVSKAGKQNRWGLLAQ